MAGDSCRGAVRVVPSRLTLKLKGNEMTNKRQILQPILDKIEPGWIIKRPSAFNPCDVDYICVFQKPSEYKQAHTDISTKLFEQHDLAAIEKLVRKSIKDATRMKYPAFLAEHT